MIDRSERAAARVVRVIGALFGVGAVLFVALLAPAILAQGRADVPPWWTAAALIGTLLMPVLMTAAAFTTRVRALEALAALTALLYLAVLVTLPLVQEAHVGVHDTAPWILGLTATGTTAAAIIWRPRWAWSYVMAVGLLVTLDRIWTAAVPLTLVAIQDGAYATFFCAVFCSLALGARRAGRIVDDATDAALDAATKAATSRAADRERQRVDALVHDEVLATLLLASRTTGDVDEHLRVSAARALDRLQDLTREVEAGGVVPVDSFVTQLRAAVTELFPAARFSADDLRNREPVPAPVAEALVAATSEALRNVQLHGGPTATAVVAVLGLGVTLIVRIEDDGVGFDPATVSPTRLGLAGSIVGRLRAVGGDAEVRSARGSGTKVVLRWPGSLTPSPSDLTPPLASPVARILLSTFAVLHLGLAVTGTPGGLGLSGFLALALIISAAAAVVLVPGPTFRLRWVAAVLAAVLAGSALVASNLPVGGWAGYAAWHLGASTFVLLALTLRGRIAAAWVGMTGLLLECVIWAVVTGQGVWHGVDLVDRQAGTLLIGTLFAIGLSRAASTVARFHALRQERVIEQQDLIATQRHRRDQAEAVLGLVRPALDTILHTAHLTSDQRAELRVLEGLLRDRIVAPQLQHEGLTAAVADARRRGMDVALLGDLGPGETHPRLHDALSWLADKASAAHTATFVGRVVNRSGVLRVSAVTEGRQEVESFPPPEPGNP